jgi:hypothetical protein
LGSSPPFPYIESVPRLIEFVIAAVLLSGWALWCWL